jgi:predicted DNA-binding transcriptional regulator YafY
MSIPPRSTRAELRALLQEGRALTQAEIGERLDVSKRHARRLLTRLREAEVPIREQQRGREKEYCLPPEAWRAEAVELELTEREALALLLAVEASQSGLGPAPLREALDATVQQLTEALLGSVDTFEPSALLDHLHFGEAASVNVDPDLFMQLVDALSNRRAVAIDYHAASSDTYHEGRRIHPWALAVRGDAWLCVARDPSKDAMRDFNLSRIHDVRPADPTSNGGDYRIDDDFDLELYFIDRFEALDDEHVYRVRLQVKPDRVPYFRSKEYHRTQQIHEDEAPGEAVVVSYEVAGLEEIAAFVRSWGPGVVVLSPTELAERIAAEARQVAACYEETVHSPDVECPDT